VKGWFQANGIDYCHHYHGSVGAWDSLGYDYYIPFNVLIDRDKNVRVVGHAATGAPWEDTIKELTGAIP
jgi:hypothetical protein